MDWGACWATVHGVAKSQTWLRNGAHIIYYSKMLLFICLVISNYLGPPWIAARWASLLFTISRSLLKLASIELVMPSNHLILCCPLLFLPSIFPSIKGFSNELILHIRWPQHWSLSFSNSPFNEYSGSISFMIDWFHLLAFQGTLESLPQHQF